MWYGYKCCFKQLTYLQQYFSFKKSKKKAYLEIWLPFLQMFFSLASAIFSWMVTTAKIFCNLHMSWLWTLEVESCKNRYQCSPVCLTRKYGAQINRMLFGYNQSVWTFNWLCKNHIFFITHSQTKGEGANDAHTTKTCDKLLMHAHKYRLYRA